MDLHALTQHEQLSTCLGLPASAACSFHRQRMFRFPPHLQNPEVHPWAHDALSACPVEQHAATCRRGQACMLAAGSAPDRLPCCSLCLILHCASTMCRGRRCLQATAALSRRTASGTAATATRRGTGAPPAATDLPRLSSVWCLARCLLTHETCACALKLELLHHVGALMCVAFKKSVHYVID